MNRIEAAEIAHAREAMRAAQRDARAAGRAMTETDIIKAILGAARTFHAQRAPIPAPMNLSLLSPESLPKVGDTVYRTREDPDRVVEAVVLEYQPPTLPEKVKLTDVEGKRPWAMLDEVYPDAQNAYWALATWVEDKRLVGVSMMHDDETERDQFLAAADAAENDGAID